MTNPIEHVNNMQKIFSECVHHLRDDIEKIDDSKCKAMFETSAEVIEGLNKAFEHYKNQSESAWK